MTRQTGLIVTIGTAVLVGCPSLFCCFFGAISAAGGGTYEFGRQSGDIPPVVGMALVGVSLVGLAIPVIVWYVTLRGKIA